MARVVAGVAGLGEFEGDEAEFAVALDVEGEGCAGLEFAQQGAEAGNGGGGFAVEGVDDVAGLKAVFEDGAVGAAGGDEDAVGAAEGAELAGEAGGEVGGEHAEFVDEVIGVGAEGGEAVGFVAAFDDADVEFQLAGAAEDFEAHGFADGGAVDVDIELAGVFHRFAVEGEDEVAGDEAGFGAGAFVLDVGDDDAPFAGELPGGGEGGGDGLGDDADFAADDAAAVDKLVDDVGDDVGGDGEAEAFTAAGLGEDEGIDADDAAFGVDEGAAGVAGVDGGVGLDVDHRVVGFELARGGGNDAEGHGVIEAEGAAKGHDDLALFDSVGIGEGEGGEVGFVDFEQGEVGFEVEADEGGADDAAGGAEGGGAGAGGVWEVGEGDLDALGAHDDVGVGDDVTAGVDDDAGAGALLAGGDAGFFGFAVFGLAVADGDDFDDGGVDAAGQGAEGGAELAEVTNLGCGLGAQCGQEREGGEQRERFQPKSPGGLILN